MKYLLTKTLLFACVIALMAVGQAMAASTNTPNGNQTWGDPNGVDCHFNGNGPDNGLGHDVAFDPTNGPGMGWVITNVMAALRNPMPTVMVCRTRSITACSFRIQPRRTLTTTALATSACTSDRTHNPPTP